MNTKRLITASIFSLISASTALAADVMIPHQSASSTSSTIVAPTFSWTGLYLGVQAGGFSSKADMALFDKEKSLPLNKEFSPKLSGFVGGFYAGSNIDLGDNFIFGIDTDLMISRKKYTKTITIGTADNATVENAVVRSRRSANPQTLSTPQAITSTGTQTQKNVSGTPAGTRTTTGETSTAGSASGKSAATQSSQAPARSLNAVQQPQAGAAQSNRSATTGNSGNVNSTAEKTVAVGVQNPGVSTPSSKTPAASSVAQSASSRQEVRSVQSPSSSLGRSNTGGASVGEVSRSQPVAIKPASSTPSTGTEASQPAAKAPTLVQSSSQPSAAEKTIPSGPLVLARSGSSGSAKASNETSGAQGHHSAYHGSGNASLHGASHGRQNMAGHGARHGAQSTQVADKNDSSVYGIEQMKRVASELGLDQEDEVKTLNHTFKQNWGGATRVRIGFAADRFMPYLAGGIAYGQFQDTVSISVKDEDGGVVSSKNLADETKTMIGYTLGGGVDFSVLDNVIVRAEYRYSDFGKKKFVKEKFEVNYKTNDFRVGVAYKF
ncbi:outer membrane beta-barrel protein [Bartonella sp. OT172YNZD]|uniref:outer membrane beta-barrel protein n=1 Tax=Bartonella sp. OT172YNZD TaxID=3243572 RepID=UPI0035D131BC